MIVLMLVSRSNLFPFLDLSKAFVLPIISIDITVYKSEALKLFMKLHLFFCSTNIVLLIFATVCIAVEKYEHLSHANKKDHLLTYYLLT